MNFGLYRSSHRAFENNQIKKVKPWPSVPYQGEHFGFSCSDPQWEFERDQRLMSDEVIEEEAPEEEEEEQVIAKLDWDAHQLIQSLRHLKLPPIKLTRRDLVVSHLPVLRLSEDDLKETQDKLEEARQEALRLRMRKMLEAEEERQRLEEASRTSSFGRRRALKRRSRTREQEKLWKLKNKLKKLAKKLKKNDSLKLNKLKQNGRTRTRSQAKELEPKNS